MVRMFPDKFRSFRLFSSYIALIALTLMSHGCGDEIAPTGGGVPMDISGMLVNTTECKENIYGFGTAAPSVLDCVFWEWDGSDTLSVIHVNAGLNCCPGTIVGLVSVDGGEITIEETEGDDAIMCHCLCLYDLSYEISGVSGGTVTITFVEQYIPEGAEPLAVTVNLRTDPTGSRCIHRDTYPWSTGQAGEDPVGTIDGYSGCKEVTGTADSPSMFSPDSACAVIYNFPEDDLMRIYHINTAYNCCIDALDADFEFGEGTITITGREHPPGGYCDCICLYDVHYTIYNLDPGMYTIRFVDPYHPDGQEVLELEVDASLEGTWTGCVHREGYPWGSESSEEQDQARLKMMEYEIVEYIGTPECSGDDDCRVIGVGSKPCGGPWKYLIYSASTLDETHLEALVAEHAAFEDYMNWKYGYMSTCDVPPIPVPECRDGVCVESRL
jgi:hypothetical protein